VATANSDFAQICSMSRLFQSWFFLIFYLLLWVRRPTPALVNHMNSTRSSHMQDALRDRWSTRKMSGKDLTRNFLALPELQKDNIQDWGPPPNDELWLETKHGFVAINLFSVACQCANTSKVLHWFHCCCHYSLLANIKVSNCASQETCKFYEWTLITAKNYVHMWSLLQICIFKCAIHILERCKNDTCRCAGVKLRGWWWSGGSGWWLCNMRVEFQSVILWFLIKKSRFPVLILVVFLISYSIRLFAHMTSWQWQYIERILC
jgi:hypothetical protein